MIILQVIGFIILLVIAICLLTVFAAGAWCAAEALMKELWKYLEGGK